ncbi:MAG: ABC transporter ATP-binding protein [bacterium]|nr:ABC transporter ATP-binding protein [bacterium]
MKVQSTLSISGLSVSVEKKPILHGVDLIVHSGEVHAIMGPNGSGKSTLSYAVMGHPSYEIRNPPACAGRKSEIRKNNEKARSRVVLDGVDVLELPPEERARKGLFLAFQSPVAIPGVSVINLLRTSFQELYPKSKSTTDPSIQNPALAPKWRADALTLPAFTLFVKECAKKLHIPENFLIRGIHDGFSGGEKKKLEMLQALVLSPKFAFFDEIDTGLDVDALKLVARGVGILKTQGTGVVIITHYQRILQYVRPDFVHVLVAGRIVESGTASLAKRIEKEGYERYR